MTTAAPPTCATCKHCVVTMRQLGRPVYTCALANTLCGLARAEGATCGPAGLDWAAKPQ